MTIYTAGDEVRWFDPELLRFIPGLVLSATPSRVLVSLNDRMCPVAVDPADRFRIQPFPAVTA